MSNFKKVFTIILGFISIHFGWITWLFLLYFLTIGIDFLTGSVLALKNGNWSSTIAREKLWKKCGSFVAILVSGLIDLLLQLLTSNMPEYHLFFPQSVLFLPLVIVWYLLAEFGSIIENAAKMGAPVPDFLRHRIKSLNETISSGENQSKNTSTK